MDTGWGFAQTALHDGMPMFVRIFVVLFVAAILSIGCSGGAKAEKESSLQGSEENDTVENPAETATAGAPAKTELVACTGGAVPVGATNCLLDLGTGEDTYWSDTDGIDPGTAGCHDEYTTDTCDMVKTGRTFGEFCLDDDRLVESNPGTAECHRHAGDKGKPGVVSCSAWCESEGNTGGKCERDVVSKANESDCVSARCACDSV